MDNQKVAEELTAIAKSLTAGVQWGDYLVKDDDTIEVIFSTTAPRYQPIHKMVSTIKNGHKEAVRELESALRGMAQIRIRNMSVSSDMGKMQMWYQADVKRDTLITPEEVIEVLERIGFSDR